MNSFEQECLELEAALQEKEREKLRKEARRKKMKEILDDKCLSNAEWAYKFGGYLLAMDRKEPRTAALALKRFWRRRALEQNRRDRRRRKKFR